MILLKTEHAVKKSRYTDEQIAYALRQAETGTPVAEVIRWMRLRLCDDANFECVCVGVSMEEFLGVTFHSW